MDDDRQPPTADHQQPAEPVGAAVSVARLAKQFRTGGVAVTAVDGITLELAPGSITAVSGPSGSGKSTLLHLIGAIESPDAGTISVDGVELTALRRTSSPPTGAGPGSCSRATTCCRR